MARVGDIQLSPPEALGAIWADLEAHTPPRRDRKILRYLPSILSTVLLSSGFHMVFLYRLGAQCFRWRLKPLCVVIEKIIFHGYGCHIPCATQIGRGLWVPHPMGIILNRRARLGRDVWLRQNVEVVHIWDEHAGESGIIGDRCELGSGAILINGGNLAEECIVGARALVSKTIPPGHLAVGLPATWRPLEPSRVRSVGFVRR